jgi:hypothetical protein
MAKSKTLKVKDISAHFFMNVNGNHIDVIYSDDMNNGAGLGAAFASAMEQDEELLKIISAALLTTLEGKEKYNSKKSNIVPKTVKKAAKKK